jgi:hypothetical protein
MQPHNMATHNAECMQADERRVTLQTGVDILHFFLLMLTGRRNLRKIMLDQPQNFKIIFFNIFVVIFTLHTSVGFDGLNFLDTSE